MTTTEDRVQLGVLCHCTDDIEGHTPGADEFGCAPFKTSHAVDPQNWKPADTYAELARTASTPGQRSHWKGVTALHRGIDAFKAEWSAREHRARRALKVVKAGHYWAVEHVPTGEALIAGYQVKRNAEGARDYLLGTVEVGWTSTWLSDAVKAVARRQAAADGVVVGPGARSAA